MNLVECPSVWVPDVFPMMRPRLCILGNNALEVKCPSQHIASGARAINKAYQVARFSSITWCQVSTLQSYLSPPLSQRFSLELSR